MSVTIIDDSNIQDLIEYYINDKTKLPSYLTDISIGDWDVSNVTDMESIFYNCKSFDESLDRWDVSNVTNMKNMFSDCHAFNKPLNNWDVSKVTNMSYMFSDCHAFNQPLNNWNVSNVENMSEMFYNCSSFNQPLNDWDISNITDMNNMFYGCTSFNQPLNNWDISNVENMEEMFSNSGISAENMPKFELQELASQISFFDTIQYTNVTALEFLEENSNSSPFIIRTLPNQYFGDAIKFPAPSENGKEFIECNKDTPLDWQGFNYGRYIKENARIFLKINGNIVLKPDWYDSKKVPGTKFFQLVDTNEPVFKFMSVLLSRITHQNN